MLVHGEKPLHLHLLLPRRLHCPRGPHELLYPTTQQTAAGTEIWAACCSSFGASSPSSSDCNRSLSDLSLHDQTDLIFCTCRKLSWSEIMLSCGGSNKANRVTSTSKKALKPNSWQKLKISNLGLKLCLTCQFKLGSSSAEFLLQLIHWFRRTYFPPASLPGPHNPIQAVMQLLALAHAGVKPNPYPWGVQKPPNDKNPHAGLWLSIHQKACTQGSPRTCEDSLGTSSGNFNGGRRHPPFWVIREKQQMSCMAPDNLLQPTRFILICLHAGAVSFQACDEEL